MIRVKEPLESVNTIESIAPIDLISCIEYVNESTSDKKPKSQEYQKDPKRSLKRKVPNIQQPYIHNYFTRTRNGLGTVGEMVESIIPEGNQGSWSAITSLNPPFNPPIKSTQSEQVQNETGGVAGTDSSLDASLIGDLIELADTAIGGTMSMHNKNQYNGTTETNTGNNTNTNQIQQAEAMRSAPMSEQPLREQAVHPRDSQQQTLAETYQTAPSQLAKLQVQEPFDISLTYSPPHRGLSGSCRIPTTQ
ncbi:hypothetical protein NDU88_000694 [Pleurodeles waltl]|uniref:Uncharacterized protein n=1 Tax=Pleurodeles waltl TaxID=8319 RepID=A0AAV7NHY8_PLEWA|nr:hypothetical protein NDU88_000694 [Pleurodeles waltl]